MKPEVFCAVSGSASLPQYRLGTTWVVAQVRGYVVNRVANKDPRGVGAVVPAQLAHRVAVRSLRLPTHDRQCIRDPAPFKPVALGGRGVALLLARHAEFVVARVVAVQTGIALH